MPSASSSLAGRLPTRGLGVAAVFALALAAPLALPNAFLQFVATLTMMYIALAMSWNIMGGLTGYISLGHSFFFGVGAYVTGLTAVRFGLNPFVTALAAGLFVGVLAAGIGYVALRVRGASFVIVTLALVYIGGLTAQAWRGLTGGSTGFTVPSPPSTALGPHLLFYYVFLALFLVVFALSWWLRRSKFGLGLVAIREDEDKAEMLGINTMLYKVVAFTLSAVFVGIGGGLYGHWRLILYPVFVFSIVFGVSMILSSLLGGLRSLWGPALGAVLFIPGSFYLLTNHPQIHVLLTGVLLGVVVLFLPDGIIPSLQQRMGRFRAPPASIREAAPEGEAELTEAAR